MVVSIELLTLYHALFECSCDAINALASALHTHYIRQGFHVTNKEVCVRTLFYSYLTLSGQGGTVLEPFCWSLGHAIQWYDILQVEIESTVDNILQECRNITLAAKVPQSPPPLSPSTSSAKNDLPLA